MISLPEVLFIIMIVVIVKETISYLIFAYKAKEKRKGLERLRRELYEEKTDLILRRMEMKEKENHNE